MKIGFAKASSSSSSSSSNLIQGWAPRQRLGAAGRQLPRQQRMTALLASTNILVRNEDPCLVTSASSGQALHYQLLTEPPSLGAPRRVACGDQGRASLLPPRPDGRNTQKRISHGNRTKAEGLPGVGRRDNIPHLAHTLSRCEGRVAARRGERREGGRLGGAGCR
ncbi:hypothetical protein E2C01_017463 [Portunus trituberculatus]|uniref:Uncharacterized protein n=1 Tax=Portunus trituberculatus TaxID=210409 RepID=A0A5B7DRR2_PORTR|nr:hypothetical protein [Portunus trituberculatus]